MHFHGQDWFLLIKTVYRLIMCVHVVMCVHLHVNVYMCFNKALKYLHGPWCAGQKKTLSFNLFETVSLLFATACDRLGGPREETPSESPASTSHHTRALKLQMHATVSHIYYIGPRDSNSGPHTGVTLYTLSHLPASVLVFSMRQPPAQETTALQPGSEYDTNLFRV